MKRVLLLARLLLKLAILQLSADPKKEISWGCVGTFSQAGTLRMDIYKFH